MRENNGQGRRSLFHGRYSVGKRRYLHFAALALAFIVSLCSLWRFGLGEDFYLISMLGLTPYWILLLIIPPAKERRDIQCEQVEDVLLSVRKGLLARVPLGTVIVAIGGVLFLSSILVFLAVLLFRAIEGGRTDLEYVLPIVACLGGIVIASILNCAGIMHVIRSLRGMLAMRRITMCEEGIRTGRPRRGSQLYAWTAISSLIKDSNVWDGQGTIVLFTDGTSIRIPSCARGYRRIVRFIKEHADVEQGDNGPR